MHVISSANIRIRPFDLGDLGISAYLDDDEVADADPETLDSDGGIETPRRPPFPKSQPGHLIETRLWFLVIHPRDDRPGE